MRKVLLIGCVVLIAACESTPPTIDYTFAEFEPVDAQVISADPLPSLSPLECFPDDTECSVVGYTRGEDVDRLEEYKIKAELNTTVAIANADALEIMLEREDAILAAAKAQETITRLREEQLAWERKERLREKWYYRFLIVLVAGAGVAAAN